MEGERKREARKRERRSFKCCGTKFLKVLYNNINNLTARIEIITRIQSVENNNKE